MASLVFMVTKKDSFQDWSQLDILSNPPRACGIKEQSRSHRILNGNAHGSVNRNLNGCSAPRPRPRDQLAYLGMNVVPRHKSLLNRPKQVIGSRRRGRQSRVARLHNHQGFEYRGFIHFATLRIESDGIYVGPLLQPLSDYHWLCTVSASANYLCSRKRFL